MRSRRIYKGPLDGSRAWFHTLPLYECGGSDRPRAFFDWLDPDSMFLPMDVAMQICRCQGLFAAELLIFVESAVWSECDVLDSCGDALDLLHRALLQLAAGRATARETLRRVFEFSFRDAELAALWTAARSHTLEWTMAHEYLCQALRGEDVLNVSTRHDLQRYCMHGLRTVTPVMGGLLPPRPLQGNVLPPSPLPAWQSCLVTHGTIWQAYPAFRASESSGAAWLQAASHDLVTRQSLLYRTTRVAPLVGMLPPPFPCLPCCFRWMPIFAWRLFPRGQPIACSTPTTTPCYDAAPPCTSCCTFPGASCHAKPFLPPCAPSASPSAWRTMYELICTLFVSTQRATKSSGMLLRWSRRPYVPSV